MSRSSVTGVALRHSRLLAAVIIGAVLIFVIGMIRAEQRDDPDDIPTTVLDQATAEQPDIMTLAGQSGRVSTYVVLLKGAELYTMLKNDGPFTVFAPTNDAFKDVPTAEIDSLLQPDNKSRLIELVSYSIVPGTFQRRDLTDGQTLKTYSGKELKVAVEGVIISLASDMGFRAVVADRQQSGSNGVVHEVDEVLRPSGV
jgi:uncharacterized surface protein with fasciclin (FAS1) repeats